MKPLYVDQLVSAQVDIYPNQTTTFNIIEPSGRIVGEISVPAGVFDDSACSMNPILTISSVAESTLLQTNSLDLIHSIGVSLGISSCGNNFLKNTKQ